MITDTSTIIMGIIFIVAIFGPLVYLAWRGKNRTHKSVKVIREVEKDHALKFSNYESWNDKAIGLDVESKLLIFVDMKLDDQPWKLLNLRDAKYCKVINTGELIQFVIGNKGSNKPGVDILTLFDVKIDDPIEKGFHSVLAKRWAQRIEENLPPKKKSPRRAA